MMKFSDKSAARRHAEKLGLCYGWSVFGAGYYTGTREELERIGVIDPVATSARRAG